MKTPRISVCELTDDRIDSIKRILREHNQSANPQWWAATGDPTNDPKPLQVVAVDDSDVVIGGLLATTQLSWLKVNIMAVRAENRRQGIGTELLATAEKQAAERGCQYAYLDTMQYQGPDFYLACCYKVVGEIHDWDSHGHTKYFFTKQIADSASST